MSGPATKRTRESQSTTAEANEPARKALAVLDSNRLARQRPGSTQKTIERPIRRRRPLAVSQEATSTQTQESAEDRTAPPASVPSPSPRRENQSPASPPSTSGKPPRDQEVPPPPSPAPHEAPAATRPTPAPGGNAETLSNESTPEDREPLPVVREEVAIIDHHLGDQVGVYVGDIMHHLYYIERGGLNYLDNQRYITERDRAILVNWMIQVAEDPDFNLSQETLFIAKGTVDRILEVRDHFAIDRFQLLATAALLLATKYNDVQQPPQVQQWTELSDNTYTNNQVVEMERLVFQDIDYNLCFPTEPRFLDRFIPAGQAHLETMEDRDLFSRTAHFYCESSLIDFRFSLYRPSLVALSSVVLALYAMGRRPWNHTLAYYSQHDWTDRDFRACVVAMQDCILHPPHPDLTAVPEKFEAILPPGTINMPVVPIFDA